MSNFFGCVVLSITMMVVMYMLATEMDRQRIFLSSALTLPNAEADTNVYTIQDTDAGIFLLNRQTGVTWRRVMVFNENSPKREMKYTYWSPEMLFNTKQEEINYTSAIDGFIEASSLAKKPITPEEKEEIENPGLQ